MKKNKSLILALIILSAAGFILSEFIGMLFLGAGVLGWSQIPCKTCCEKLGKCNNG
jgi:hypothetical protein